MRYAARCAVPPPRLPNGRLVTLGRVTRQHQQSARNSRRHEVLPASGSFGLQGGRSPHRSRLAARYTSATGGSASVSFLRSSRRTRQRRASLVSMEQPTERVWRGHPAAIRHRNTARNCSGVRHVQFGRWTACVWRAIGVTLTQDRRHCFTATKGGRGDVWKFF